MSDNFPNIKQNATEQSMELGMQFIEEEAPMEQGQFTGGRTKIRPSADAPHPGEVVGYGYMSPELKDVGRADSNDGTLQDNENEGNTSGIPAAQPIPIMTFGDPNDTVVDFKDNFQPVGKDIENYGFDKPN